MASTTSAVEEQMHGFDYCSAYCEENVYRLVKRLVDEGMDLETTDVNVIFISSLGKATPIWHQRASTCGSEAVYWDYHVVLQRNAEMLDLDTLLPFPVGICNYVEQALRPQMPLAPKNSQRFRVVPASIFLARFSSNRSHMSKSLKQRPKWPFIQGPMARSHHELPAFWNVSELGESSSEEGLGVVLDREAFFAWALAKRSEAIQLARLAANEMNSTHQATRLYSTPPVYDVSDERRETGNYGLTHMVMTITVRCCFSSIISYLLPSEATRLLQARKMFGEAGRNLPRTSF